MNKKERIYVTWIVYTSPLLEPSGTIRTWTICVSGFLGIPWSVFLPWSQETAPSCGRSVMASFGWCIFFLFWMMHFLCRYIPGWMLSLKPTYYRAGHLWTGLRYLKRVLQSLPLQSGNGLPFPSPEHLPNPGIEPRPPALQADSLLTELWGKPLNTLGKPLTAK